MKHLNFKTVTLIFFLLLLAFNLIRWFGGPSSDGFTGYFYQHSWLFYGPLFATYLIVPVIFSFFPCSRFHSRNVICKAETPENHVSLTFDDGPDPVRTPRILDILKTQNVQAAFFLTGKQIPGNEALVVRIFREGHVIGNHSYTHSNGWDFKLPTAMRRDILVTEKLIEQIIQRKTGFFRPPYGVINPMVEAAIQTTHYKMIGWSKRSLDTCIRDEEKLLHRIAGNLGKGDIILLHDTQEITVNMLEKLILTIRHKGFQLVSPEQLLKTHPYV
ncbi:MAG: polysaccharide deacetylase family protein [Bacteroidota bacterium]